MNNIIKKIYKGLAHIKYLFLVNCYILYYRYAKPCFGLNADENRKVKVIVSLTSYPDRFKTVDLTIKSLMNQTCKPDKIILYLDNVVNNHEIGENIRRLRKYGLEIKKRPENIRPHKKYYYAMKEYPDDIIITVDDDMIYARNLVKELMKSYMKYPKAVSAMRVHKMLKNNSGALMPYNDWEHQCKTVENPSLQLVATGVGGILYPPHCMSDELFNLTSIKELCILQDDLWLKFIQILSETPVVYAKSKHTKAIKIPNTQDNALFKINVSQNNNEVVLEKLSNYYNIDLAKYIQE